MTVDLMVRAEGENLRPGEYVYFEDVNYRWGRCFECNDLVDEDEAVTDDDCVYHCCLCFDGVRTPYGQRELDKREEKA